MLQRAQTDDTIDLVDDQVGGIWCMPFGSEDQCRRTMGDLLHSAATDQHLLLVDWRGENLVDLRDRGALNEFLN